MLTGAAWSIQQSLDGLGVVSTSFVTRDSGGALTGSYWSPGQAVLPILGALCLFSMLLSACLVTAGYVLGRRKGACVAIVLLALPGALSVMSLWPNIPYLPSVYTIGGTGMLGTPWGVFYLLLLAGLTGWVLGVFVMDALNIDDKFWGGFDHLWYAAGLVAVVFFVADVQSGGHVKALDQVSRDAQRASAYLHNQIAEYDKHCRQSVQTHRLSCEWASDVLQRLLDYQTVDAKLFAQFGPKNSADLYQRFAGPSSASEIETIRSEISAYNAALCPVRVFNDHVKQFARPSAVCQSTPHAFCQSIPDSLNGKIDEDVSVATVAIASECIVPTLVRFRAGHAEYLQQVSRDQRNKHYRWFYYLMFAVVAGFKMSNGTMKLTGLHS